MVTFGSSSFFSALLSRPSLWSKDTVEATLQKTCLGYPLCRNLSWRWLTVWIKVDLSEVHLIALISSPLTIGVVRMTGAEVQKLLRVGCLDE